MPYSRFLSIVLLLFFQTIVFVSETHLCMAIEVSVVCFPPIFALLYYSVFSNILCRFPEIVVSFWVLCLVFPALFSSSVGLILFFFRAALFYGCVFLYICAVSLIFKHHILFLRNLVLVSSWVCFLCSSPIICFLF